MLTHISERNQPEMVDVGAKAVTARMARARATVILTPEILATLEAGELHQKKGPVFQTAIIAGVMAAKRTHEWIPLCHPIPLDDCKVTIEPVGGGSAAVRIEAVARATHRTGVEMEALTAVSAAALTVYDMCKALSHDIRVQSVELVEKRGGKRDFLRDDS